MLSVPLWVPSPVSWGQLHCVYKEYFDSQKGGGRVRGDVFFLFQHIH